MILLLLNNIILVLHRYYIGSPNTKLPYTKVQELLISSFASNIISFMSVMTVFILITCFDEY